MRTCLVSLVSDQTIPNILMALYFRPDFLLLITTGKMEQKHKSQAIIETLKLRGLDYSQRHHRITVIEDSVADLQARVSHWLDQTAEEFEFIVNLTGGTKLMSLAAYDLFKNFGSTMVYVPINKNEYLTPFSTPSPSPVPLADRLTVLEYLTAYGIRSHNQAQLAEAASLAESRQELTRFIFDNYRKLRPLLERLGRFLRKISEDNLNKPYDFKVSFDSQNPAPKSLLQEMGFTCQGSAIGKSLTKSDWHYLRGGWLEERLFLAVRAAVPQADDIKTGVVFNDAEGNENELDVVFTHENVLHLVECKSLGAREGGEDVMGGTIRDFLYKLGALRQQFGLTPKGWLATTSDDIYFSDGRIKESVTKRARQFGIEILPLLQVNDLERHISSKFSPQPVRESP